MILALIVVLVVTAGLLVRARWIETKLNSVRLAPPQAGSVVACGPRGSEAPIVLVGDSRVSRWPADLLPDGSVVNRGQAGETALRMADRFAADVLARCPRTILIESGINDLVAASLMDADQARGVVARVTRTLIDLAEQGAASGAQVFVGTIIPPGSPDPLRRLVWSWSIVDHVAAVNAALRAHAWRGHVTVLDFASQVDPRATGVLPSEFRQDTLHLNTAGYRRLSEGLPFAHPPGEGASSALSDPR